MQVEALEDRRLLATFTVSRADDGGFLDGELTFRQAIEAANSNTRIVDTIAFAIAGAGVHTIRPATALPTITDPVIIDGYTQGSLTPDPSDDARPNTLAVGTNAVLLIELAGDVITAQANGLTITGGGSTVRGLAINRFTVNGIQLIAPSGGTTIEGNYLGTDATGTFDLGNSLWGVYADNTTNTTVGGTTPGARNVISGNGLDGVHFFNGTGNLVQGNYIGTDASGTRNLGNTQFGVVLFSTSNSTIGGTTPGARNVISGNDQIGVSIRDGTGHLVQGNYIGTDATGTRDLGNSQFGVDVLSSSNSAIGGTTPGARNVISGNNVDGILIELGSSGILVQGNYIGTDVAGTGRLGNGRGVSIRSSSNNTIGGATAAERNVISGNDAEGVTIANNGTGNRVQGNFIGTDVTGFVALGNGTSGPVTGPGVLIFSASNNTIGGATAGERNLISGNVGNGVLISNATGNRVQGNFIGTDVTGTVALGNTIDGVGISSASNNTIGGATAGERNVISGNVRVGVYFDASSTGNRVQGNFVGTDVNGSAPLGNREEGVIIVASSNNTIGGTGPGEGNVVAFNRVGVRVETGNGNGILTNSIFSNRQLGIDLGPEGGTPNDPLDPDAGGNNLQNSPVITAVTVVGGSAPFATVTGFLNSAPNTTYRLEFFSNPSVTNGFAQGRDFLGVIRVTTDSGGNAPFSFATSFDIASPNITATATDPANNTSEFYGSIAARADLVITMLDVPDPVVVGQNLTYFITVTNNGPDVAPGVSLVDTLPAGVTFVSASQGSFDSQSGRVIASLGDIAVGQSVAVTIVVTPNMIGTIVNTASVSSRLFDDSPADNAVSVPTTVTQPFIDPLIVTNTLDAGLGSLRQAILTANALPGVDRIIFRIPGAGPQTIRPLASLPAITDPTIVDATTQPGFAGRPIVAVDGTVAGTIVDGLTINAGGSTIRGLAIHSFGGSGILVQARGGNVIVGSFIGLDPSGTRDRGNAFFGIRVDDVGENIIGGTTPDLRNVISGNDQVGIRLTGPGASRNRVLGNYIGTDAGGDAAVPNFQGVLILGAPRNLIGGTEPGAGNVISGNTSAGIHIFNDATIFDGQPVSDPPGEATGNVVQGNLIGTNAAGTAALANFQGIFINDASGNRIGGTSPGAGNVISGNLSAGIQILGDNATGNVVERNSIGTDRSGRFPLGNDIGVFVYSPRGNVIDRSRNGAGNNIVFNRTQEVRIRTLTDGPTVAAVAPDVQDGSSITSITLTFSIYMNRARASDAGNYSVQLLDARGRRTGRLPVVAAEYSEVYRTVRLVLATPLGRDASFRLRVQGGAPDGLTDRRGNPLNGANRRASRGRGSDFVALFGPGRRPDGLRAVALQTLGEAAPTSGRRRPIVGSTRPGQSLSPRAVDSILGPVGLGIRVR